MAIACSPATPAPRTSARAGVIVPAAVIISGKMRGSRYAAITAAWYPGERRHRRQDVHVLRPADAGHRLQPEGGHALIDQRSHQVRVARRARARRRGSLRA